MAGVDVEEDHNFRVVRYIIRSYTSQIPVYVYPSFRKRRINIKKIGKKLDELYGKNYNADQFIQFGEQYLNQYLIEKHNITFKQLLIEAFMPVIHRYKHLV